jgi:hypothetical protein
MISIKRIIVLLDLDIFNWCLFNYFELIIHNYQVIIFLNFTNGKQTSISAKSDTIILNLKEIINKLD